MLRSCTRVLPGTLPRPLSKLEQATRPFTNRKRLEGRKDPFAPHPPHYRELPLVDFARENFFKTKAPLENTLFASHSHVIPTKHSLFSDLMDREGLRPDSLIVAGKPYSDHLGVYESLRERGVQVVNVPYDSHKSFEHETYYEISEKLADATIAAFSPDRHTHVFLDIDGTPATSVINRRMHENPNLFEGATVVGFEQTNKGWFRLEKDKLPLKFSVIDYARSLLKTYEMPFVVEAVWASLKAFIADELDFFPRNCLVIGAGALGLNLFKRLMLDRTFKTVHIHDADPEKGCYRTNFLEDLKNYDLVLGCTGRTALTASQIDQYANQKRPTVFASTTSSDDEFESDVLRKRVSQTSDCHKTIRIADRIILPLCGHPFPFYLPAKDARRYSSGYGMINKEVFQIPRAGVVIALAQMLNLPKETPAGPIQIDPDMQQKTIYKWITDVSVY